MRNLYRSIQTTIVFFLTPSAYLAGYAVSQANQKPCQRPHATLPELRQAFRTGALYGSIVLPGTPPEQIADEAWTLYIKHLINKGAYNVSKDLDPLIQY